MKNLICFCLVMVIALASCNNRYDESVPEGISAEEIKPLFEEKGYILFDDYSAGVFSYEAQDNLVHEVVCFQTDFDGFDIYKHQNEYFIYFDNYSSGYSLYPRSSVDASITQENISAIKDSIGASFTLSNFIFCVEVDSVIKTNLRRYTVYGFLVEFQKFQWSEEDDW